MNALIQTSAKPEIEVRLLDTVASMRRDKASLVEYSATEILTLATQDNFRKVNVSSDNPNVKTVIILNGENELNILGRILWV